MAKINFNWLTVERKVVVTSQIVETRFNKVWTLNWPLLYVCLMHFSWRSRYPFLCQNWNLPLITYRYRYWEVWKNEEHADAWYLWINCCMNNLYISHGWLYAPTFSFWAIRSMLISIFRVTSWFDTVCNIVTRWVNFRKKTVAWTWTTMYPTIRDIWYW